MNMCASCGAPVGPPDCRTLFERLLALDHGRRPPWGALHGVSVACYRLQHADELTVNDRRHLLAVLLAYDHHGARGVNALLAAHRWRLDRTGRPVALPSAVGFDLQTMPSRYNVRIADVAVDGTFPAASHADRVAAWAGATLNAWTDANRP